MGLFFVDRPFLPEGRFNAHQVLQKVSNTFFDRKEELNREEQQARGL